MRYSIEDLYFLCGQYDKTATLSFYPGSDAHKKFGGYATGDFYYTYSERLDLQKKIDQGNYERTDGIVKLKVHLSNVSPEIKNSLKDDGFLASDIYELLTINQPAQNQFKLDQLKELPKPTVINVEYSGHADADRMMVNLNQYQLDAGYKLTPFEIIEHNATILKLYKDQMTPEDLKLYIDEDTGRIRDDINYQYLSKKFLTSELSTKERSEWERLASTESSKRVAILVKELQRSQEKFKELGIQQPKAIRSLIKLSATFKDMRLITSKYPIWLDFERFLHIFMRHVRETKVGERFAEKSVFPYEFSEIIKLIKMVLESIIADMEEHFEKYPDKIFYRQGDIAVYFQGDYYAIHIDQSGRLLTFFKDHK